MWLLYLLVGNFGVAMILLTLIVKAASFPLTLKQQKNMAVSQLFMPRVQEIQKKYKNNQAKLQEEMGKLQKEGYNPMGGCGPMILIMVILFGVIDVVYKPMTHLEHFEQTEKGSIEAVKATGMETDYTSIILGSEEDAKLVLEFVNDPNAIIITENNPALTLSEGTTLEPVKGITARQREEYGPVIVANLGAFIDKTSRLSKPVRDALNTAEIKYRGLQGEITALQAYGNSPDAFNSSRISPAIREKMQSLKKNMMFLGLDLGGQPSFKVEPLLFIPIFAFVFSMLQMLITQKIQEKSQMNAAMAAQPGMKAMLYVMPFFSLFISFNVPAGAGLYWGVSYLVGIAQSLIMQKFWPNEKLREQAKAANAEKIKAIEPVAKVVAVDEEGNETVKTEKISQLSTKDQKEYFRKKLEDARREDALKYGDELPDESNDKS